MNRYTPILISAAALLAIALPLIIIYPPPPKDEPVAEVAPTEAPAHKQVFSPPELSVPTSTGGASVLMNVSAYCPGPCCCGKWADGTTASGQDAVGKIVAAPPNIAFGTVLIIPGYGVAVVQDRGGAITGNKIDVLFTDSANKTGHQKALEWGRQELMVKVKARLENVK